MKKRVLFSLLMATIFMLLLAACGGGTTKPPFSEVALNCSEQEVVSAYGECQELTVNDDGGNIYKYPCTYQEKEGNISVTFASDGKVQNISWDYNPQSEDEYNDLVNTIVEDYTKAYGNPSATNLAGSVWNLKNANVGLFKVAIGNTYKVRIVFNSSDSTDVEKDSVGASEKTAATSIYHKGETANGNGFTLSIDSVDATPEFLNYEDADSGYEYFFVSFELENTSSEPLGTNNFFSVYADETECKNITFLESYNGVDKFDVYSDLPAGRKVKSYISAIVPEKWNTIQLACADGTTFSFAHTDLGAMSAQENSSEELVLHTGDTMTRNGMQITLKNVIQTDYIPYLSSMYYEPEVGNHFLVLFFDITNTTSSAQQFSIITAYDAYIDDYSGRFTTLSADINGESDLNDYDYTDILSGKSISGYKTIEVPDGWKKVELASRQGTFEITPDVVTIQ